MYTGVHTDDDESFRVTYGKYIMEKMSAEYPVPLENVRQWIPLNICCMFLYSLSQHKWKYVRAGILTYFPRLRNIPVGFYSGYRS